eukprot:319193-Prorocentrum_minimum.AAC.2
MRLWSHVPVCQRRCAGQCARRASVGLLTITETPPLKGGGIRRPVSARMFRRGSPREGGCVFRITRLDPQLHQQGSRHGHVMPAKDRRENRMLE